MPANKARSQPPSSKETSALESSEQKKNTNGSIASYLQIPSSINNSKGSLAEFAAQVWKNSVVDGVYHHSVLTEI
jgi:hypothetical protein